MNKSNANSSPADPFAAMESELSSMPWMERRNLVAGAILSLRAGNEAPAAEKMLLLLALDAKWEVRNAVADQLLQMPEALYAQIIVILANDPNTFVRHALQREMARRSVQATAEKRRHSSAVKRLTATIESRFGSEVVRMARKLSEMMTEQVIRTTVHDIKGILTPIKPYLDGLRDSASDKTSRRRVDRIRGGIEYLERMLTDMGQWAEDINLVRADEDLVSVIESAVQDACDHLRAQNRDASMVAVSIDAPSRPQLSISRPRLQMAFTNLIKNGIEAHAISNTDFKPGTVTISVAPEERFVQVSVTDTGKGFNAHDLEKLIEFVPGNSSKKYLGTGCGVPIANKNVEAHGGKITVTSVLDGGTTVTVMLPREPLSN